MPLRSEPDLILIDSEHPTPICFGAGSNGGLRATLPVLLFAGMAWADAMRALQAGVNVVIVGACNRSAWSRKGKLTLARFEQDDQLRQELDRVNTQLADRKSIERAKGILMREQHLDEDSAYHRLRRLAMDRANPWPPWPPGC